MAVRKSTNSQLMPYRPFTTVNSPSFNQGIGVMKSSIRFSTSLSNLAGMKKSRFWYENSEFTNTLITTMRATMLNEVLA